MLALSSPLFSPHGWPLMEDHDQYPVPASTVHGDEHQSCNYNLFQMSSSIEASDSLFHHHHNQFIQPPLELNVELEFDQYDCNSNPSVPTAAAAVAGGGDIQTVKIAKKLNHNASERDRRKKINSLYSSLRSLLPQADQMKKLSNPATISRILSYIPELQKQVEALTRKKEEILTAMDAGELPDQVEDDEDAVDVDEKTKCSEGFSNSSMAISATKLNQTEMTMQISLTKTTAAEAAATATANAVIYQQTSALSRILICLEEEGLLLLNSSSFQSLDGKIFHNLHLQVKESSSKMEPEKLSNKLLQMFP